VWEIVENFDYRDVIRPLDDDELPGVGTTP
jgi:hypothetical protein